jgi:hypothetical protein
MVQREGGEGRPFKGIRGIEPSGVLYGRCHEFKINVSVRLLPWRCLTGALTAMIRPGQAVQPSPRCCECSMMMILVARSQAETPSDKLFSSVQ